MKILSILLLVVSCRSLDKRLVQPVDDSKNVWEFCTPEMIPDYQGRLCLVKCAKKLKKNGECEDDKYIYPNKELKTNHEFFMNSHIIVPEGNYY